MSEKVYKKVSDTERRINIEELIKMEVTNVIVTERNEPNITLMAKAWLDLMKQT